MPGKGMIQRVAVMQTQMVEHPLVEMYIRLEPESRNQYQWLFQV